MRDRFEEVQKAYEYLNNKQEGEKRQQLEHFKLVLHGQTILYTRYAQTLEPFKYAGYPMLLPLLEVKESMFSEENAPIVSLALLTVYLTIRVSSMNGLEFFKVGGLEVLEKVLRHTVSLISVHTSADDPTVKAVARVMQIFVLLSDSEQVRGGRERAVSNRAALLVCVDRQLSTATCHTLQPCGRLLGLTALPPPPRLPLQLRTRLMDSDGLIADVCRNLEFTQAPLLNKHTLKLFIQLSERSEMQELVLHGGGLWRIVPYLFRFDHTLQGDEIDWGNETSWNAQLLKNELAKMAAETLQSICGMSSACPAHPMVTDCVRNLLTPGLALDLAKAADANEAGFAQRDFLERVNQNIEEKKLIWNQKQRDEMIEFCEVQLERLRNHEHDPFAASAFKFESIKHEMQIEDVYVRVLLESEDPIVDDPERFLKMLVVWLMEAVDQPLPDEAEVRGERRSIA